MTTIAEPPPRKPGQPRPPKLTGTMTYGGYAIDPQKLLDEIVRLEALVAKLAGERDRARDLAIRAGAFD